MSARSGFDREERTADAAADAGALIVAAEIAAGHDGAAELVVTLQYANGGRSNVILPTAAGLRLMHNCNVQDIADLRGHSWRNIID